MPTISENRLTPILLLILAMLLWSSSFVALKYAFQSYHPMLVIFARMFIGTFCFLPFLKTFRRITISRRALKYLLLMTFCEPCLYFIFEAKAIENTTASQAGMITAVLPLLVAILAWGILRERVTRQTQLGFLCAVVGAVILSLAAQESEYAPNPLLGNFYEFLAMVCAAGYTISLKYLSRNLPPLFLTAIQAFVGAVFFLPFVLFTHSSLPEFHLSAVLAVVYLGTFVTFGAYGCYNFAVSRVPASQAAGFINLIPVFSVVLGMILLDERMNPMQLVACALVFFGVYLSGVGRFRSKSSTQKK